MSEKKEDWKKTIKEMIEGEVSKVDKKVIDLGINVMKALETLPSSEREKSENKHLHTLKEQIDCPSCYPELRKKVFDKEFKNADAQCLGCGLLAKKENAEKEEWNCPNCGSKEAEIRN